MNITQRDNQFLSFADTLRKPSPLSDMLEAAGITLERFNSLDTAGKRAYWRLFGPITEKQPVSQWRDLDKEEEIARGDDLDIWNGDRR